MSYLLNALYLLALVFLSPWLVYKALTTGKYRRGLRQKLTGGTSACFHLALAKSRPTCWFHAVSVGEIHLLRQVVAAFRRRHPDWQYVISTTTDTGFEEACKCFADLLVIFWPLDFSWAVQRALRQVDPSLIVLAEGELWPNFLIAAKARGIPVAVINGRMSPRSLRRYRWFGPLARRLFDCVDLIAAQTEEYASCYRTLGARSERVHVTGSVKYDGVEMNQDNPKTNELARLLNVRPGELIWVAGSTQAPEEEIALTIFRRLRHQYPNLRLFLVPRQKDRFEEVAGLLRRSGLPFVRRSTLAGSTPVAHASGSSKNASGSSVVLVDTIGELGALWGLADVAFVGGSMDGQRGGQNMIEPAAYGAAVVFGPHVWNFRETASSLIQADAARQIGTAVELEATVKRLLSDADERSRLGRAAQRFVSAQQGATERTLDCLDRLLATRYCREEAA